MFFCEANSLGFVGLIRSLFHILPVFTTLYNCKYPFLACKLYELSGNLGFRESFRGIWIEELNPGLY